MQGNPNLLCGPVMRSNCCCDSHSTMRRVSCKIFNIQYVQYLLWHKHEHVVRHCCCYCYETLRGSEVRGKRSRGGAMATLFWKVSRFAVQTRTGGLRFRISPPWDPFSKKCIFRHCIFKTANKWPKRCNTCAFSPRSIFVWTAPMTA